MPSLKTYTAKLAKLLGTTPAVMYERQRALVKAGLLINERGRGPGSGVKATGESVATLLVAAISANNLSETAERMLDIAATKSTKPNRAFFLDTVVDLLKSKERAGNVHLITISRSSAEASITYGRNKLHHVHFFTQGSRRKPLVRIIAEIDGDVVREIASDLANMAD
jgi:hypothetical protein